MGEARRMDRRRTLWKRAQTACRLAATGRQLHARDSADGGRRGTTATAASRLGGGSRSSRVMGTVRWRTKTVEIDSPAHRTTAGR